MSGRLDAAAAERLARAVELRVQGKGLQEIADELGYESLGTLSRRISGVLKARVEARGEALLQLEAERLDKAAQVADELMAATQTPLTRARGVEGAVRVSERRSRLFGLDHGERRADAVAQATVDRTTVLTLTGAMNRALARCELTEDQRMAVRQAVAEELARLATETVEVVAGEVEE